MPDFVLPEGTEPAIIERLQRFSRLAAEFREESDRGCAVMIGCLLEDNLRDMFKALCCDDAAAEQSRLFPKGSIEIGLLNAKALGLLSDRQVRMFRGVVKVRNKFAHGVLENLQFDHPEVRALVTAIEPAIPFGPAMGPTNDTPRGWFLMHAGILIILMMIKASATQRLPIAPDFDATGGFANPAAG